MAVDARGIEDVGYFCPTSPPRWPSQLDRKPNTEKAFDGRETSCAKPLEIEIGVPRSQCLDRRIDSEKHLVSEIVACAHQRHTSRVRIKSMFATEKARTKIGLAEALIITVSRY